MEDQARYVAGSTDVVERVAMALAHNAKDPGFDGLTPDEWWNVITPHAADFYRGQARAAIAALREPSTVMRAAMRHDMMACDTDGKGSPNCRDGVHVFQAGIDAALGEI